MFKTKTEHIAHLLQLLNCIFKCVRVFLEGNTIRVYFPSYPVELIVAGEADTASAQNNANQEEYKLSACKDVANALKYIRSHVDRHWNILVDGMVVSEEHFVGDGLGNRPETVECLENIPLVILSPSCIADCVIYNIEQRNDEFVLISRVSHYLHWTSNET